MENFIVSRDVIFDETESKSAEEIESILHKLETKGSKRKGNMQSQPTSPKTSGSSSSSSASPTSSSSSDSDSPDSPPKQ